MNRTKTITGIVIVILLGIGGFFFWYSKGTADKSVHGALQERSAEAVFALTLADFNGNPVRLADFKGKNIIVNVWASWCPYCREELSYFESVQGEYGEKLVILAANHGEKPETAERYLNETALGRNLIYLLDSNDSLYKTIQGFSMPETIFIDKQGAIRFHKRGPMNREEIRWRAQDIFGI
ncbi:MAG: hypothetical protein A2847_02425 [Candidatus Sungbacteria bacterium RIFCSPHIGHO2_01_FULL_50_25]|uniref:Thioredoxin domain-containing protein n=1 Tax=Candidatus Sungbacteria bacterium RIFCSPHIGHO2_01_FULL_50_25 TaxID=1802265 RepID=A0A1G2K7P6_9BACT|nr:MAG: hypothetical protein A2847_02425 [Candidatus Sungbacteria bacterium RIFCSPHIGHO2_01_FULL_50_25]